METEPHSLPAYFWPLVTVLISFLMYFSLNIMFIMDYKAPTLCHISIFSSLYIYGQNIISYNAGFFFPFFAKIVFLAKNKNNSCLQFSYK